MLPSSAFHSVSVCLPLDWLTLADLHRVSTITAERLATTSPPPSIPRAGIFAPHSWAKRCGSSPVPTDGVLATRSCPLYTGCAVASSWSAPADNQAGIFPFGSGVSASFAWLHLRCFRRGVPLVSRDRKDSASLPAGWKMSRIVRRLRTPNCAAIGRTLHTLRIMTHMRLSMSNTTTR